MPGNEREFPLELNYFTGIQCSMIEDFQFITSPPPELHNNSPKNTRRKPWQKLALSCRDPAPRPPAHLNIDKLHSPHLESNHHFDFLVAKLRDWNKEVSFSTNQTRKYQELVLFIFEYLQTTIRQSKEAQILSVQKLFEWYHQKINPRPKIIDILRMIKRRKAIGRGEDHLVRKTFTKDMTQRLFSYKSTLKREGGDSTLRFVSHCTPTQNSSGPPSVIRFRSRNEQRSRAKNQEALLKFPYKQISDHNLRKHRQISLPIFCPPKNIQLEKRKSRSDESEKGKISEIAGLTLMVNPFFQKQK